MPWLSASFRESIAQGHLGIALTGAGSWLGQALLSLLDTEGALTPHARLRLFASSKRAIHLAGRDWPVERLIGAAPLFGGPWLLLHFAFLGKETTRDLTPVDFIAANDNILAETLRIAASVHDLRVAFASSGAVYRDDRALIGDHDENPYGWCKVAHEQALTEWCDARVPLVLPRIFNIGGPFANKVESYALSSFILSAARTGTIGISATRPTYRSYVHVNELVAMLCDAAQRHADDAPLVFDTVGEKVVEMGDLAAAVAATFAPRTILVERATPAGGEDRYVGRGDAYANLLASQGRERIGLPAIVRDTADFLRRTDKHRRTG